MEAPPHRKRDELATAAPDVATEAARLAGARVVVVGLGRSGGAAAGLLARLGARVTGNDVRPRGDLDPEVLAGVEGAGASLVLGGHSPEPFEAADLVVVSPGVPPLDVVEAAYRRGVPVWSELELASRFVEAPILAVTGTNGKSTVVSLLGEIARATGRPTFVGGNLGTPLVEAVGSEAAAPEGLVVVEASSFQLERVDRFRPRVAALLNVSEDHLDRYDSFAGYAATKGRIFHAQRPGDVAVVRHGDAFCASIATAGRGRLLHFGGEAGDVRVDGDALVSADGALRFPLERLPIRGLHNVDNACAAAVMARAAGLPLDAIEAGLATFPGLPHRMAAVGEVDGVTWFDDSKATNVGAALASLAGLAEDPRTERVVLLLGGVDKGGSYAPLVEPLRRVGRAAVVYGAAAAKIADALGGRDLPLERADGFDDAVRRARAIARPGDAVLLAPACASFDEFRSYAHRGERFAALVAGFREGRS